MMEMIKTKGTSAEASPGELLGLQVFLYISCGEVILLQFFKVTELTLVSDVVVESYQCISCIIVTNGELFGSS